MDAKGVMQNKWRYLGRSWYVNFHQSVVESVGGRLRQGGAHARMNTGERRGLNLTLRGRIEVSIIPRIERSVVRANGAFPLSVTSGDDLSLFVFPR